MSEPALKVYASSEHTFNAFGLPLESGRGDDAFLAWDQTEDDASIKVGVDGEATMSAFNNRTTEVTATFMSTSDANTKLTLIHNTGKLAGAPVRGPIFIRDRQGSMVFAAENCWIKKPPAQARGKEVGTLEWVFIVHNPKRSDGGA